MGDGDSCGSGPESVIIEKEDDGKSPSPEESGVNGEEIINSSSTSQAVISGTFFVFLNRGNPSGFGRKKKEKSRDVTFVILFFTPLFLRLRLVISPPRGKIKNLLF